jgi:molybdopterin-biosynthesis enzyme MoeA-like protein
METRIRRVLPVFLIRVERLRCTSKAISMQYGRQIRDLTRAALRNFGKPESDLVRVVQKAEQPAPNLTISTPYGERTFQIAREEVVVSTPEQIEELVRSHVRFAYEPDEVR